MNKDALISTCGSYRYRLTRVWDEQRPKCAWVMLNPSTADAQVDDPTIRRIIGFSKTWGWGGTEVLNLFALRSTSPTMLREHSDPIGPDNDKHLLKLSCDWDVIAAWGDWGNHLDRASQVRREFANAGITLKCLGRTKNGSPKHPLYVRGDTRLVAYPHQPV